MAGFGNKVQISNHGFGRKVQVSSAGFGELVQVPPGGFGETVYVVPGGFGDLISISGCFPKTELVFTGQNEYIPIASIKVGSKLFSWNAELKKPRYTAVSEIHEHKVYEIICLNGIMRVSSCHPLLIVEKTVSGLANLKWKAAYDVEVGDCLIGNNGNCILVQSKSIKWHASGIDVINLSTDCGSPFIVGGFVARADNADDNIGWADSLVTKKILTA
jgi:hypothetical protein